MPDVMDDVLADDDLSDTDVLDGVLSVEQTGQITDLSKFTLARLRQRPDAGGLPWLRLSENRVGYLRRDVAAYLRSRRVGSLPKTSANPGGEAA